jgi:hypothetical protein
MYSRRALRSRTPSSAKGLDPAVAGDGEERAWGESRRGPLSVAGPTIPSTSPPGRWLQRLHVEPIPACWVQVMGALIGRHTSPLLPSLQGGM